MPSLDFKTIGLAILAMRERQPDKDAIQYRTKKGWQGLSWQNYFEKIEKLGAGFLSLNIQPQDRIAIMSNTRYEWAICDFAILGIQAVTVPVYQNNTTEDVEYILNDSQAKILIVENKSTLKVWEQIKSKCSYVQKVIIIESDNKSENYPCLDDIIASGEKFLSSHPDCYKTSCEKIQSTDFATLLYTSGTTGQPKGVVLTHEQIVSEVGEAFPLCGINETDTSLAFLPFAHILGRVELWGHAYCGSSMAFAESIERIRHNLAEIKPTYLMSVPRIFEKIYSAIWAQMETQPMKMKLFKWALNIGQQVSELKLTRQMIPLTLLTQYEVAKKLVLNKITNAFGGQLRFAISGGAPISKEVALFFHAADILILEGYGLTETTAAITVNTPFNYRFGSVGRPIGDVQLKIADDGEILVKSKKVMKEYYKNPAATAETINEGWFATGDIGEILPSGDLKITDRKKDLIKTAGGKYVAPQRLEGLLKLNPLVGHVLIHGDQKKYIIALITPDKQNLEHYAKEHNIEYSNWLDLLTNSEIQDLFRKAVADTNTHLASYESIKKYEVLKQEFTIEGGELTPSLKVKRKFLDKKFKDIIDKLYS